MNARGAIICNSQGNVQKIRLQQGRSHFGAWSVLSVREYGKMARTPLADISNIPRLNK